MSTDKKEYVYRRRLEGATQAQIATELGVTKQRVHQIASDLPTPCQCGCGELIPPLSPGVRVYMPGHRPVAKCPHCGKTMNRRSLRCRSCDRVARRSADLSGQKIGRWEVLGPVTPALPKTKRWWCRCECGVVKPVCVSNVQRGLSLSCAECGYDRRNKRWAAERARRMR